MTDDNVTEEQRLEMIRQAVGMSERLHMKLHAKLVSKGLVPVDAMIGAVHAAIKTAAPETGGVFQAIEWMRSAVDHAEMILIDEIRTGGSAGSGNTIQ